MATAPAPAPELAARARAEQGAYAAAHDVAGLLQHLIAHVVTRRPAAPALAIADEAARLADARAAHAPAALQPAVRGRVGVARGRPGGLAAA
jgi:hypothetical protein